ncbi:hypothetical protein KC734_07585 [candidate division KSB1 bacterium]|nr:hypothetical protein [candidate division KSB1 bacterium]
MQEYYLQIEAVNHAFSIYDTHDISTIRGGSYMVLDAFKALEKNQSLQGVLDPISVAASEAIYRFEANDEQDARKIQQDAIAALGSPTRKIATFVSAIEAVAENSSFPECLEKLKANCRLAQYQSPSLKLPALNKTCASESNVDGVRPSTKKVGDTLLSDSVDIRRKAGRPLKAKIYNEILGNELIQEIFQDEDSVFVNHLEQLSSDPAQGILDGKIAFIYIDGNRFGRIREKFSGSKENLKRFQSHIRDNIRKPALKSILEFAISSERESFRTKDGEIRLETLLWGGDEIEWVVPAWHALDVLELFYTSTAEADEIDAYKLTHSAGVVFCHHNLPILQVRKYAHELCEIAKSPIPKDVSKITREANHIAILNMTAFDLIRGDVRAFLQKYHHPATVDDFVFRASDFAAIAGNINALKTYIPKGKIHEMSDAVKANDQNQIEKVWQRIIEVYPQHAGELNELKARLFPNDSWASWFAFADLMNYVGGSK